MSASKRVRASAGGRAAPPGANTPGGPAAALGGGGPLQGPARVVVHLLLLVLGAVAGVAGALLQGALFPGGLLLALAASAGLFLGAGLLTRARSGTLAAVVGWLVMVVLLTTPRPEGDFLFAAGAGAYLFLLGSLVVAVLCATLWQPGRSGTGGGPRS